MIWYKIQFEIKNAFKSEEFVCDVLDIQNQVKKAKIILYESKPVFTVEFFISVNDISDKLIDLLLKYNAMEIFPSDVSGLKAVIIN